MRTSRKQLYTGFFDEVEQLEKLSKLKDPLEKLNTTIDFEIFRATLNHDLRKDRSQERCGSKSV